MLGIVQIKTTAFVRYKVSATSKISAQLFLFFLFYVFEPREIFEKKSFFFNFVVFHKILLLCAKMHFLQKLKNPQTFKDASM